MLSTLHNEQERKVATFKHMMFKVMQPKITNKVMFETWSDVPVRVDKPHFDQ